MANYTIKELYQLEVKKIKPDPNQPRKHFDQSAMNDLTKSVKEHGVIQPIIVRQENDQIILVAGERRLKAAGYASQKTFNELI